MDYKSALISEGILGSSWFCQDSHHFPVVPATQMALAVGAVTGLGGRQWVQVWQYKIFFCIISAKSFAVKVRENLNNDLYKISI